jgi:hypothetical protein
MQGNIDFQDLPDADRTTVKIFRAPLRERDEGFVLRLAGRFGLGGPVEGDAAIAAVQDRAGRLEVFTASRSLRWKLIGEATSEPEEPASLPDEGDALRLADAFLQEHGLVHELTRVRGVSDSVVTRINERGQQAAYPITRHVDYGFSLDGLEVFGPGSKIQVTFDQPGRVCEVLRFWREVKEEQALDLISAEDAAQSLREVVAPEGVAQGTTIVFYRPDLGYYALPPRELQPALIPAYRFRGAVHRDDETYRFLRFVPAVRPDADAIKELGVLFHRAPKVF